MKYDFLQLLIANKTLTNDQVKVAFTNKNQEEIDKTIKQLIDKNIISFKNDFYSLSRKFNNKLGVFFTKNNEYGFIDLAEGVSYFVPLKISLWRRV
ncbi:MAG: hypothetical protein HRS57_01210 [Mycoplasmataceae bacterium]|nr:hypothetical protein [Mycoplasmataceae bacterium]